MAQTQGGQQQQNKGSGSNANKAAAAEKKKTNNRVQNENEQAKKKQAGTSDGAKDGRWNAGLGDRFSKNQAARKKIGKKYGAGDDDDDDDDDKKDKDRKGAREKLKRGSGAGKGGEENQDNMGGGPHKQSWDKDVHSMQDKEKKQSRKEKKEAKKREKQAAKMAYPAHGLPSKHLLGLAGKTNQDLGSAVDEMDSAVKDAAANAKTAGEAVSSPQVAQKAQVIKHRMEAMKTPHGFICGCLGCNKVTGGCCGGSEGHKLTGGGCGSLIGGFPGCSGGGR
ncbi:MAG: hypothetical protein FWE53_04850 [Firmicutes bacterium]|nr:hypothetical protein [Bacillota bacterium]